IEFLTSKQKMFLLRMVEQLCHIEHYRNEIARVEGRELSSEQAAQEWISKYAESFPR
ncbi:MAG: PilZ domain-containing protein, partial [Gammaproteobacteria bacterium]